MTLLENHILDIHSVEACEAKWIEEFPHLEFVKVDVTVDCHGSIERKERIFQKEDWKKHKDRGYFLE
jgi:hypothetical protein